MGVIHASRNIKSVKGGSTTIHSKCHITSVILASPPFPSPRLPCPPTKDIGLIHTHSRTPRHAHTHAHTQVIDQQIAKLKEEKDLEEGMGLSLIHI